jgi:hypothetical protein
MYGCMLVFMHASAHLLDIQAYHEVLAILRPLAATYPHRGLLLPVRPYYECVLPREDAYTRQLHHPCALAFLGYKY